MKYLNKIMLVLAVSLGFAACSSDDDYSVGTMPSNDETYFANTMPKKVEVNPDATSFTVTVSRVRTDNAISVPVTITSTGTNFTPETQTLDFAAGEANADLTFSYNPTTLEYDQFDTITVTLDPKFTSAYGASSYKFCAGIPAPWVSLGKGKFFDGFLFDNGMIDCEVQQHAIQTNHYRLVNPYKESEVGTKTGEPYLNFYILQAGDVDPIYGQTIAVDNTVVFCGDGKKDVNTGYFHSSYGENIYALYPGRLGFTPDQWINNRVTDFKEDGTPGKVEMAPYYYLFGAGGGWDNTSKATIIIYMPGYDPKDFALAISYKGRFTTLANTDEVMFSINEVGADLASLKLVLVESPSIDVGEALGVAAIEAGVDGIVTYNLEEMEMTLPYTVSLPIGKSGKYTAVLVGYDAKEQAQATASATFKFLSSLDNPPAWTSLGKGQYTDDALIPLYGQAPLTYEVEVQECADQPGLYRLVNPYGEIYPYNEEGDWDDSHDYYLEINCCNPNACFIEEQDMGLDWGEGGNFFMYSYASYYMDNGYSADVVMGAGLFGTLADGVITFPAGTLLCGWGSGPQNTANDNGAWKVVLPGAQVNDQPAADDDDNAAPASVRRMNRGKAKAGNVKPLCHRMMPIRDKAKVTK